MIKIFLLRYENSVNKFRVTSYKKQSSHIYYNVILGKSAVSTGPGRIKQKMNNILYSENSTCNLGPIKHRENVVFERNLFRIILQHIHYVD